MHMQIGQATIGVRGYWDVMAHLYGSCVGYELRFPVAVVVWS
jgi:hypothetical protein